MGMGVRAEGRGFWEGFQNGQSRYGVVISTQGLHEVCLLTEALTEAKTNLREVVVHVCAVHAHVSMCTHTYVCMCALTCVHVYVCACVCLYAYPCVHEHACECVC